MAFRNPVTTLPLDALTGQLTADQLPDGVVTSDKIAPGAITETQIAPGSITTPLLAAGAVTAEELAADAITGKTIAGGTITGAVITGSLIQTADQGRRWVLSDPSQPGQPGLYGHVPNPSGGYSLPAEIIAGSTSGADGGPNLSIASGTWSGWRSELYLSSSPRSTYAALLADRVEVEQLDFSIGGQHQAVAPLPTPWVQYGRDGGGAWQPLTVLRLGRALALIAGMIKCTADTAAAVVSSPDALPDWARPAYLMGQLTRTSTGTDARLSVLPSGVVQLYTPAVTKANSYAYFSFLYLLPNA